MPAAELLSPPTRLTIDSLDFHWRRSSYDHSTSPAIRYVTYLCEACLHELKMPVAEYEALLHSHAETHATEKT